METGQHVDTGRLDIADHGENTSESSRAVLLYLESHLKAYQQDTNLR